MMDGVAFWGPEFFCPILRAVMRSLRGVIDNGTRGDRFNDMHGDHPG